MRKLLYGITLLLMCSLVALASWPLQDEEEDEIRDILRVKRAALSKPVKPPKQPGYRRQGGQQADRIQRPSAGDAMLGVTLWRLRPSKKDDALEIRDLIQPEDGSPAKEWTPERIESDTPLREEQMVRLTIESFRTGYIYVINRSKYKDGYGDPYLIFPTERIDGGNNYVEAGKTVRIPAPEDKFGFFVVKRGKSKAGELQISEELIIIIKPEPFESLKTPPADRKLLATQSVQSMLDKYSAPLTHSEMKGSTGQAITVAEVKAARERTKRLNEDDPLPQSVYRAAIKATDPMLVRLELKVESN